MEVQAIQTRYKGVHFRSRSEARTAVFLDACDVRWRYEVEGFNLGDSGLYLPDFHIIESIGDVCWLEIKPRSAGKEEVQKWKDLAESSGIPVIVFNADFLKPIMLNVTPSTSTHYLQPRKTATDGEVIGWFMQQVSRLKGNVLKTEHAVFAARSARFEHGQSGAT